MLGNIINKNYFCSKLMSEIEYMHLSFRKEKSKKMDDVLKIFLSENQRNDKNYVRKIKKDLLFCRRYYMVDYSRYFIFHFERLNEIGRKEFVGEKERIHLINNLKGKDGFEEKFRNKYEAYTIFRNYYKREVIKIQNNQDHEVFIDFAKKHSKFMIKKIDIAKGEGIYKIDQNTESIDLEELFVILMKMTPCVLEEYVEQDKEMAKFHPESVNTIRFVTFLKDNKLIRMFALLRMGCGGSHVDNAGAGGLVAAIDIDTGIVKTLAYRENNTCYLQHPDTGVQIIGAQIPKWEELLVFVDELVKVIPEQKYVGWDLALTTKGWCMIEGNDNAMITGIQMCEQRGIRQLINEAFKA